MKFKDYNEHRSVMCAHKYLPKYINVCYGNFLFCILFAINKKEHVSVLEKARKEVHKLLSLLDDNQIRKFNL
jgi:hypothetical protein